jgi:pyrimidine operon attenuation protein/uracil phosphoribosyltransferase
MPKSKAKGSRLLNTAGVKRILERLRREILRRHREPERLVFIGIRTRGFYLARRLRDGIKESLARDIPLGEMDIVLYRDDLNTLLPGGRADHTHIPFDINNKAVVLFDDVLNTGRTIRAAVDHLIDLGRPRTIQLAVLIDRGGRELPIAADFVGKRVALPANSEIQVKLREVDGLDEVLIWR